MTFIESNKSLMIALALVLFSVERIASTFNAKSKKKVAVWTDQAFTSGMLFFYAAFVIGSAWYYFSALPDIPALVFWGGIFLVVVGSILRKWAISTMGDDWCVYISAADIGRIAEDGPYAFFRHPYYLASLLELTGVSLALGCYRMLMGVYGIYLPLLLLRCYLEEKNLISKFSDKYFTYRKKCRI